MPQHVLDYFDLIGLFAVKLWLAQANWLKYVTLSLVAMPKRSVIWPAHPGMLVDLLLLAYQSVLDTFDIVARIATLLGRLIVTSLVHGHGHEKGHPKLCRYYFWHGA